MILVFMAMYGVMFLITQYFQLVLNYTALSAALRLMPLALIMLIVAPLTPRIIAAFGANRTVAVGMSLVALGLLLFRGLTPHTAYWYVVVAIIPLTTGIAMTMAPMTAAIMSAVPLRRAGSGSAMNDATRELGAALGIAVLGSVAASRYANALNHAADHLTPAQQAASKGSLAGAQQTAATLRPTADKALTAAANHAFVDGIHLAVTVGAIMALIAAACVLRWLPRQLAHQGAMHGAEESLEVTAELAAGRRLPHHRRRARPRQRRAGPRAPRPRRAGIDRRAGSRPGALEQTGILAPGGCGWWTRPRDRSRATTTDDQPDLPLRFRTRRGGGPGWGP